MDLEHVLPDLIILDYHLGRPSRQEPLWQQLKANSLTSALPLILCTADAIALREQADVLREAGVRVVLKPFAIGELLQIIQQALQETTAFKTA
jgi:CheY-like chemotaxis protein